MPGELDGVRLLWHNDYWDGPVSGLAEYHGKEYWFQAIWDVEADDWEHPRRYVLRELTDSELVEEWRWHRLFEERVSTLHCHHDDAPQRAQRPETEHAAFYDAYGSRDEQTYDDRPVVGEFRLGPG